MALTSATDSASVHSSCPPVSRGGARQRLGVLGRKALPCSHRVMISLIFDWSPRRTDTPRRHRRSRVMVTPHRLAGTYMCTPESSAQPSSALLIIKPRSRSRVARRGDDPAAAEVGQGRAFRLGAIRLLVESEVWTPRQRRRQQPRRTRDRGMRVPPHRADSSSRCRTR